jgi:tRNA threonylcarbamoyladenosine biosynthesis protein TsaE
MSEERFLADAAATRAAAAEMAERMRPTGIVALIGPLGAGKTTYVKGFAEALGISEAVTSPTFVRLNVYEGDPTLYHLDLYRVEDTREFVALGLYEWLDTDGIALVEWADRAAGLFPPSTVTVTLDYAADRDGRIMTVTDGPPRPGQPPR